MSENPIVPTEIRTIFQGRVFSVRVETIPLPKGGELQAEIIRHPGRTGTSHPQEPWDRRLHQTSRSTRSARTTLGLLDPDENDVSGDRSPQTSFSRASLPGPLTRATGGCTRICACMCTSKRPC